ncbi:MAG: cytochrome C [Campylobacterota bacterium]|nr:cytochrome C [Campylobacterota bacterium]
MKKIVLGTLIAAATMMAANYAPCAGCHGAKGEKKALGKSMVIAGWDEAKTIAAMKGYKDGSYGGPMKGVMKGQVARLSDADIADLAKQIAGM